MLASQQTEIYKFQQVDERSCLFPKLELCTTSASYYARVTNALHIVGRQDAIFLRPNMNRRKLLAAVCATASAFGQATDRDKLIGTWRLRSNVRTFNDGRIEHPYGQGARVRICRQLHVVACIAHCEATFLEAPVSRGFRRWRRWLPPLGVASSRVVAPPFHLWHSS